MRRASIFFMVFACFPAFGLAADIKPVKKFELGACTAIPGLPEDARCGTYEVWENRAAKSGRRIPLRVAVIPATGPDRLPDPFIYFNGGPGDPAVPAAPWIAQDFAALRKRRDLLFVDFRGTSGPKGLFCPELEDKVRIETVGRQLRVREGEYPPTMLAAVSPTRFRMEGTPPSSFYDFQVTDGQAAALRIVSADSPPQTPKREGP